MYFDKYVFKYKVLTITNNDDNSIFACFLKTRIYLCKIIFKNNQQLILFVFDDDIITTRKHYFFCLWKLHNHNKKTLFFFIFEDYTTITKKHCFFFVFEKYTIITRKHCFVWQKINEITQKRHVVFVNCNEKINNNNHFKRCFYYRNWDISIEFWHFLSLKICSVKQ